MWWRRIPLKLLIATAVVSRLLGEWYPFSRFEMFSRSDGASWYLYLADGDDRPIPIAAHFGVYEKILGKQFRKRWAATPDSKGDSAERARATAAVGADVLEYLLRNRPARKAARHPHDALHLWRVDVTIDGGRVIRTPTRIAEYPRR